MAGVRTTHGGSYRPELLAEHVRLRGVNERMRYVRPAGPEGGERTYLVLCECGLAHCRTRVPVSFGDYERVRASRRHFVVAPHVEHVAHDVCTVVSSGEAFWVVQVVTAAGGAGAERVGRVSERRASGELWKSLLPDGPQSPPPDGVDR